MKQYTTIEQSKKLLELGLSPESADMCYIANSSAVGINVPFVKNTEKEGDISCWSVGALIELMPQDIYIEDMYPELAMRKSSYDKSFHVSYEGVHRYVETRDNKIINACYKMVVALLENGYIKKG